MSKFEKSAMTVNGNSLHMSMPISKVDEKKRLVSGYATLDNLDSQGDVVLAEASKKAFSRARGNIREMHQPLAVGRMVDFREDEYFDKDSGELYRGIYVTARVSEGAEDTWKKVLDGTLTGFSIGGEIKEASNEFVKEAGTTVRFIKDYDLVELSLVDNPANQLANIESFQKNVFTIEESSAGTIVKGMIAETVIENVFICKNDDTIKITNTESEDCPVCGSKMENAGWFEESGDRAEKVREIVSKFLNPADKEAAPTSEGGVEMGFLNKAKNDDKAPEAEDVEVVNPSEEFPDGEKVDENAEEVDEAAGTEEESEEAETPDEVEDEQDEISKKMDALHDAISESLEKSKEETLIKVAELEKKVDALGESLANKTSDFEEKFNELGEKLETAKNKQAQLEKTLEVLNSSEAIKKSSDLEPEEPVVQKTTFWGDAFSPRGR